MTTKKPMIDNISVNIQSHPRSLCSSNESGRWEQPWDYSMPPLFQTTSFEVKPLCTVSEIIFKQSPMETLGKMNYATIHVTNLIRRGLFDGSKDKTEVLYTESETKDILACLVMFRHPFICLYMLKPWLYLKKNQTPYLMLCCWCWYMSAGTCQHVDRR